jgi:hypothetical protein
LSILSNVDFSVLIFFVPLILVLGGLVAVSKGFGVLIRGPVGKIFKIVGFLGFFVGVFLLIAGITVLLSSEWDIATWGLLILTGLGLSLKPLSRVPFSALFGLVTGVLCVGLVYLYFPLPPTILGFSSVWLYLIVFLIPALLIYLIFKFTEDLMKLFSILLGSWPIVTIFGLMCVLQGVLLLFNNSLISLFI